MRLHRAPYPLGNLEGATRVRGAKQDDVLVAPVANHHVRVAHAALDDTRDLDQQFGSDAVTVGVVDALEVVQVQKEDAERRVELLGSLDLPVDGQIQISP